MLHASRWTRTTLAVAIAAMALGACAKGAETADSGAAAGATTVAGTMPADSGMAGHDMSGMSGMTGNADQDFLRMMADHHAGLLVMTGMVKARTEGTAPADARRMDLAQTSENEHMTTMLKQDFKDTYTPKVAPKHQAMADALRARSGADYDRTFYQNVIAHHREAITMIDAYLPKAKNAMLKSMAEKMKADQTKEIAAFEPKARA